MAEPLVVSIPHKLGQAEAIARLKRGLGRVSTDYSSFMTIEEETWVDNRLSFRMRAVGQTCSGVIDVREDHVRLEVVLPWLLAKVAERLVPTIQKEATLMLEKK
jgi:hypothetical protein